MPQPLSSESQPETNRPPVLRGLSIDWPPIRVDAPGEPRTGESAPGEPINKGGSGWAFGNHISSSYRLQCFGNPLCVSVSSAFVDSDVGIRVSGKAVPAFSAAGFDSMTEVNGRETSIPGKLTGSLGP